MGLLFEPPKNSPKRNVEREREPAGKISFGEFSWLWVTTNCCGCTSAKRADDGLSFVGPTDGRSSAGFSSPLLALFHKLSDYYFYYYHSVFSWKFTWKGIFQWFFLSLSTKDEHQQQPSCDLFCGTTILHSDGHFLDRALRLKTAWSIIFWGSSRPFEATCCHSELFWLEN